MSGLQDIWNDRPEGLPEEKLMAYLEGRLSPEEQHEVEAWLAEEGMESDALEGLHGLPVQESAASVSRLNHELRKTLLNKKSRRRKSMIENRWSWIAIIIILLLVILAYMIVRMSVKK
jgi:anti-sigma factor RsiW